jgi:hypothetical protein
MAKHRYKATLPLLLALERRAEAMSGEFKSQNVAKQAVGVCDDGGEAGGADAGATGTAY